MIRLDRITKTFRGNGPAKQILRDVSFALPDVRGLALIGRNGAGKSTLLRLIAGTLEPDSGQVFSDERISWPMGFSGGFHPALTGAQNIRFVARLYGKDPEELARFVTRFGELGRALRKPFETYSSGMKARLAFAVSIGLDFDCYLVDEIIGVGDAAFREKCRMAFRARLGHARLVMVSHNPQALRQFCDAGLVIEAGRLKFYPRLDDALAAHAANLAQPVPA
ncbi:MAG: ABC transporter ATP-binding protein [Paracoccaceae bacterium]